MNETGETKEDIAKARKDIAKGRKNLLGFSRNQSGLLYMKYIGPVTRMSGQ